MVGVTVRFESMSLSLEGNKSGVDRRALDLNSVDLSGTLLDRSSLFGGMSARVNWLDLLGDTSVNNSDLVVNLLDGLLENGDVLNKFLNSLSKDSDLSGEDWLLRGWSGLSLDNKFLDGLSDDNQFLDDLLNLLGDLSDDLMELNDLSLNWGWVDTHIVWSGTFEFSIWIGVWSERSWGTGWMVTGKNWFREVLNNLLQDSDMVVDLLDVLDNLSVLSLDNGNLLLEDLNLFDESVFLLNDLLDVLLDSLSFLQDLLDLSSSNRLWNWFRNSVDSSLDVNNLLDEFLNGLLHSDNLLLEGWSLRSWSSVDLSLDDNNLLLDDVDLLNDLINLLLEDVHSLLFFWVSSWGIFWLLWKSWSSVSDSMDGLLDVSDLLSDLLNSLLENDNLLSDDRLLWSWGSWKSSLQLLDVSLDDSNLLNKFGNLLVEDSNNLLFNRRQRSDVLSEDWFRESNMMNSSVNLGNLLNQFLDSLSKNSDLLLDDWSLWSWSGWE